MARQSGSCRVAVYARGGTGHAPGGVGRGAIFGARRYTEGQSRHELPRIATGSQYTYFVLFYTYFAFGVLLQVFPPLLDIITGEFGVGRQLARA
jgi:hypothetical protein